MEKDKTFENIIFKLLSCPSSYSEQKKDLEQLLTLYNSAMGIIKHLKEENDQNNLNKKTTQLIINRLKDEIKKLEYEIK